MMLESLTAKQYSKISEHTDDWFSQQWDAKIESQVNAFQTFLARFNLRPPLDILDLTCGVGTQSIALSSLGHNVTAMDISSGQLEQAKQRAHAQGVSGKIDWLIGDAAKPLETCKGFFDIILSFGNSFPLLGDESHQRSSLDQSFKLLKNSGYLFISIRDHSEMRKNKPYITISGKINNGSRKGIWLETADWNKDDKQSYDSHIIFIITEPEKSEFHYYFPNLTAFTPNEFKDILKETGYKSINHNAYPEFHMPEFPIFKGQKI